MVCPVGMNIDLKGAVMNNDKRTLPESVELRRLRDKFMEELLLNHATAAKVVLGKRVMLPAEAVIKIKEIVEKQKKDRDNESAHLNADDLLCNILYSLGYEELVEISHNMPKWYA